jgi:tetratricopeptide (TPR) repeat protein
MLEMRVGSERRLAGWARKAGLRLALYVLFVLAASCLYTPLLLNMARLVWLKSHMTGPSSRQLELSDALLHVASPLGVQRDEVSFLRGLIALERGDSAQASTLWGAHVDDERLSLYIHGQERAGTVVALCTLLQEANIAPASLYECGLMYARQGLDDRAIECFRRLAESGATAPLRLRPEVEPVPAAYAEMGKAYYRLGDEPKALEYLLRAESLAENPGKLGAAYTFIGMIYVHQRKYDLAQRYLGRAPDDFYAHMALGDIGLLRRDWQLAETHYKRAAELKPDDPRPHLGLAAVYKAMGFVELANEERARAERLARH